MLLLVIFGLVQMQHQLGLRQHQELLLLYLMYQENPLQKINKLEKLQNILF